MKQIFQPVQLPNFSAKNRLIRSATHEGLADADGHLTQPLFETYRALAQGGVGTIITGYTFVHREEQPTPHMMGIYSDDFIPEYQTLTQMAHRNDTRLVMQLVYGGSQTKMSTEGRIIWGPSDVPNRDTGVKPMAMGKPELELLKQEFAAASRRVKQAGFDAVQIHAAHGYLLNQFLSPYYNRRTDQYGGSVENRARYLCEIIDRVRAEVGPNFPVWVKINCEDGFAEGLSLDQSKQTCRLLETHGVDLIEISGGTIFKGMAQPVCAPEQECYFAKQAIAIKQGLHLPIALVGGNRNPERMEALYEQQDIDLFSICRPLMQQPDLINQWIRQET